MVMGWKLFKPTVKNILSRILSPFVTPVMATNNEISCEYPILDSEGQIIDLVYAKNILKVFFEKYHGFTPEEISQEISGLTCDESGMWTTNKLLWTTGVYLMTFDYVCKNNIFDNVDDFNDVAIVITSIHGKYTPICILQPVEG